MGLLLFLVKWFMEMVGFDFVLGIVDLYFDLVYDFRVGNFVVKGLGNLVMNFVMLIVL